MSPVGYNCAQLGTVVGCDRFIPGISGSRGGGMAGVQHCVWVLVGGVVHINWVLLHRYSLLDTVVPPSLLGGHSCGVP